MRLVFWGTRGSISVPSPHKTRYGSNTACVSIQVGDHRLILDAGFGIVPLGERLMAWRRPKEGLHLDLFLTHLHWDHVIGLPFFTPVFFRSTELTIWGRREDVLRETTERLFTSTYSPIKGTENLGATLAYQSVGADPVIRGPFRITSAPLRHPGGCLAYRVEAEDKAIVYATDHESGDPETDRGLVELSRGADVLIHDAHFTPTEFTHSPGYGHSSWQGALATARAAGVSTLVLFHHHHLYDDVTLDGLAEDAQAAAPTPLTVLIARDGLVLDP